MTGGKGNRREKQTPMEGEFYPSRMLSPGWGAAWDMECVKQTNNSSSEVFGD